MTSRNMLSNNNLQLCKFISFHATTVKRSCLRVNVPIVKIQKDSAFPNGQPYKDQIKVDTDRCQEKQSYRND